MKRSFTARSNRSLVKRGGGLSRTLGFISNYLEGSPPLIGQESPEARLAAIHEGCLSMMVSGAMAQRVESPGRLMVAADLILDNISVNGWSITSSHFLFIGKSPETKTTAIQKIAAKGQGNSPLSGLVDGFSEAVNAHRS